MRQKIDIKRNRPLYTSGGRAPGTEVELRNCTILLESQLRDQLLEISKAFISPINLKSYGVSAIVRHLVSLGIQDLRKIKMKDLVYYKTGNREGVGREGIGETVKTVVSIPVEHIIKINKHRESLDMRDIGTTTYIRLFIHKYIDRITIKDLYDTIPIEHKVYMFENDLTPKKLAKAANI